MFDDSGHLLASDRWSASTPKPLFKVSFYEGNMLPFYERLSLGEEGDAATRPAELPGWRKGTASPTQRRSPSPAPCLKSWTCRYPD
jgi:hypothetical protein